MAWQSPHGEEAQVGDSAAPVADEARDARARMQHSAVRGSVWTVISAVIGLPVNLIVNVIVVRLLGPVQFGLLATLMAAIGIGMVVLNAGVSDASVQWGASDDAAGRRVALVALTRRTAGFHVFVQTPASVLLVLVLLRDASVEALALGCVGIALTMVLGTSTVVQVAINRTARNAQIVLITNVVLQGAVVVAAAADGRGTTVWATRVALSALPAVVILFTLPGDLRRAVLRPALPFSWPQGFARFAGKALLSSLLAALVFSRSEIFVLQHYGFAVAAGIFALAFGLSYQLTLAVDALLQPLVPAAAGLIAVDSSAAERGLLRALRITSTGTAIILAILMPAVAVMFTTVYGADFAAAAAMFVPLSVVSCLQSANGPVTAFISGARRLGSIVFINMVAFLVDLVLAIALIPLLGAWGAIIANSVGQLIAIAGSWWVVSDALKFSAAGIVGACAPVVRGAIVGVPVAFLALTLPGELPSPVVALAAAALGVTLLAASNVVGGRSLGPEETALLVGVAPRAAKPLVMRFLRLMNFIENGA